MSRFLLDNLSKFSAEMLIKCCNLPLRNTKSAKASRVRPEPRWGRSQRSPKPEVESSRTSLASRKHFEVLGLELGPRKLPCPRLEDSTIFWIVEILLENARNLAENLQIPFSFSAIEISRMMKMWQKSLLFLQFQFLFSIFPLHQ